MSIIINVSNIFSFHLQVHEILKKKIFILLIETYLNVSLNYKIIFKVIENN